MSTTEPRFLTVQEAAELVRLSTKTVYRLIAENKIPSIKIGDNVRIPVRWRDQLLCAAEGAQSEPYNRESFTRAGEKPA